MFTVRQYLFYFFCRRCWIGLSYINSKYSDKIQCWFHRKESLSFCNHLLLFVTPCNTSKGNASLYLNDIDQCDVCRLKIMKNTYLELNKYYIARYQIKFYKLQKMLFYKLIWIIELTSKWKHLMIAWFQGNKIFQNSKTESGEIVWE